MAMPNRNFGNNAAGLLQQAVEEVPSALVGVGFATSVMAVHAADSPPTESGLAYPVRQGITAGTFFCGVSTMWAAGWVAADPARRRAPGRIILCSSLVPMLIAVGLSNDYDVFFDILRAIARFRI